MAIIKNTMLSSLALLFIACSSAPSRPITIDRKGVNAISSEADMQLTFIKANGHLERFCAARPSDVADTYSSGMSVGVDSAVTKDGVSEGNSQGALSLGGRSPSVLIVREMMYRACELSLNLNANAEQTLALYMKFMDVMKEMVKTQTENGSAALGQSSNAVMKVTDTRNESTTNSSATASGDSTTDTTSTSDTSY